MKIYIAASSQDIDRAERLIAIVRDIGHDIGHDVYDWPAMIRRAGPAVDAHEMRQAARDEMDWIIDCQCFLLLAPACHSGALVEYGIALASRELCQTLPAYPQVHIVDADRGSIFARLADRSWLSEGDWLTWLRATAR